jgi:hypothetical protein
MTVANTPEFATNFSAQNLAYMRRGSAPIALTSQSYGSQTRYILHHIQPIQNGGGVYDMTNILVVTPLFHQYVLDRSSHFGKGGR